MSIFNNGIEIIKILQNGIEIDKIMSNGVEVFTKASPPVGGTHVITVGNSGSTYGWFTGQFGDMTPKNIDGQTFTNFSGDDTIFSSDPQRTGGDPDIMITGDGTEYTLPFNGVFDQYIVFEGELAGLVSYFEANNGSNLDLDIAFA